MRLFIISSFLILICFCLSFRCAEISDSNEILKILNDFGFVNEMPVSETKKRPFEEAISTVNDSSTGEPLPVKKRRGRDSLNFDSADPELREAYLNLDSRSKRVAYLRGLLLAKFNEVFDPPKSPKIIWSRVKVLGWPEGLRCFSVIHFSPEQCLILLKHFHEIRFEVNRDEQGPAPPKKDKSNEILFQKLKGLCREFPEFSDKRGRISWQKLHDRLPTFVLKTLDYRVWSARDRKMIQDMLIDGILKR